MTAIEAIWWAVTWSAGIAPAPSLAPYLAAALLALGATLTVRRAIAPHARRPAPITLAAGSLLVAVAASLFLPLKYAIPRIAPFWLDPPLMRIERGLFGSDPWQLLDRALGWAAVPIDRAYAIWLPVQLLVLFAVMVRAPSPAKSRALIAYSLGWFVLGVALAESLSSAGPIFYDRLYGGHTFAALRPTLETRGATMVLTESDAMWASLATGHPSLVAGMSAVPSLHVAISLWMYLSARTLAPRARGVALAYFLFIWIASVQLGWHYAIDGLVGALGMILLWSVAGLVERNTRFSRSPPDLDQSSAVVPQPRIASL